MRKKLSKLFISAARKAASTTRSSGAGPPSASPELATLKKLVPTPLLAPSPHASAIRASERAKGKRPTLPRVSSQVLSRLKKAASKDSNEAAASAEESAVEISREISSILRGNSDAVGSSSQEPSDGTELKNILDMTWFSNMSETSMSHRRKEISRDRKKKCIFKNSESRRFTKLMKMCASKIGTESTLEVFGRLGRETGIKEYNALIKHCMSKAGQSNNDDSLLEIHRAYQLLVSMKERGFQVEEESYGPILMYLINMGMAEEFQMFSKLIKEENSRCSSRVGYYEMLLWIRTSDENKIRELCNSFGVSSLEERYSIAENYLLAFCDSDRKEELLQLLEVLDISRISSVKYITSIFKALGRLQLEDYMMKFVSRLKTTGAGEENVSSFIYDYANSIPNLAVEEVILKFINLHEGFEVIPSPLSCDMLIKLCCNSLKVHAALDIIDRMYQYGLEVPVETFHPILHACEQTYEFYMVHSIYSVMRCHNLKPKGDTFKSMISMCVKMKDFEGAYNLLTDAEDTNEMLTASMYNVIMAGYFREKNNQGALMVLKQMEDADIKPDSETYSYLIANCENEDDVVKYCAEMQHPGVQLTKHVYMAIVNAYAKFGNFGMAKQIVLDPEVPSKYLNEIKSVLVSALSSNGQILDALSVYDEMKQAGCSVEPKAIISLIEHLHTGGELDRLLQLLEELNESSSWFDGCSRVVLYCVHHNLTNSAIELLKQLKKKDKKSTYLVVDQIFSQIWKSETTNLETSLELFRAIKEDLGLHPSRISLDFLLSSCVKAKDPDFAWLIWSEYEDAGLSYNVLTYLRMYQALLASGRHKVAKKFLKKIPNDDPHVQYVIQSCKVTYKSDVKN